MLFVFLTFADAAVFRQNSRKGRGRMIIKVTKRQENNKNSYN